ncbi:MAG: hypothetical protein LQ341_007847, partial [Variospora aurantia]
MARERPGRRKVKPSMDWSAFTDVPYLLVTAGLFCAFWGIYFGFYFIVTYAQETLRLSASEATNLLILMVKDIAPFFFTLPPFPFLVSSHNAANLPGRFLPPLISDSCLGPLNTLIPCTFLTSTLLFLWLGAETPTAIHLLACFYGFAAAGIQSLYNAAIWGAVRVPLAVLTPPDAGAGTISSSAKRRRKEVGEIMDDDDDDGDDGDDGDEDEENEEDKDKGTVFDEGKARLRLAM